MRKSVFVSLAVDKHSVICVHAQLDLGMPIADMSTLCIFRTFKRTCEKNECCPTHSYVGSVFQESRRGVLSDYTCVANPK